MEGQLAEKVACLECGKPVSASLASRREGLCLRCGAQRNPFFVLYSSLIERVCHSPSGFDALSDAEKLYYALTLFQNEVNNGGFHQVFFNSSGSYYDLIENGLVRFNEPRTLELPHQAKHPRISGNRGSAGYQHAPGPYACARSRLDEQIERARSTLLPMSRQPQRETAGLRTRTGTGLGGNRRLAGMELSGRSHSESKNPSANSTRGVSLSSHKNTVGAHQTRLRG
jgi:hypothetical protein